MASSKVMMASTNSRNTDLTGRPPSSFSKPSPDITSDYNTRNLDGSIQCYDHLQYHEPETKPSNSNLESTMTVDGLLRSVYGEDHATAMDDTLLNDEINLIDAAGAISAVGDCTDTHAEPSIWRQNSDSGRGGPPKSVDDIWRDIVFGRSEKKDCKMEMPEPDEMMTLEDFLARAGAVDEEDVKEQVSAPIAETLSGGMFTFDPMIQSPYPPQTTVEAPSMGFGNGAEMVGGVGRGKRRAGHFMETLDKASQQRQRRMIKNRESAARSRERKQAYQYELESLVAKLEDENEKLRREKIVVSQCNCKSEDSFTTIDASVKICLLLFIALRDELAHRTKERLNQLMEKLVPVVEKRRPHRMLRRVHSMQW